MVMALFRGWGGLVLPWSGLLSAFSLPHLPRTLLGLIMRALSNGLPGGPACYKIHSFEADANQKAWFQDGPPKELFKARKIIGLHNEHPLHLVHHEFLVTFITFHLHAFTQVFVELELRQPTYPTANAELVE